MQDFYAEVTTPQARADIAVIGAGHAGLAFAAAAGARGLDVVAIDRAAAEDGRESGRGLALMRGSIERLARLALWPAIAPIGEPIVGAVVRDAATGETVRYDAAESAGRPFGHGVAEGALRAALAGVGGFRRIAGELAALRWSARGVDAVLACGRTIGARLVVGADGRGSKTRALLRLDGTHWRYGQEALVFTLALPKRRPGEVREILAAEGPLALLPLPGGRAALTWATPPERAAALQSDRDALMAALRAALARAFGDDFAATTLEDAAFASPIARFPLGGLHATRYVARRAALIGDAAHGVHPIHAQGFNMAIADVEALVELVAAAARKGDDVGAADLLFAYDRARRGANATRVAFTDGLARLIASEAPPALLGRKAGFAAMARSKTLRRAAVRFGAQMTPKAG